jgi:Redoxin.
MWILLLLQSHAITQQIDPRASDAWPLEIGDRMPDIRITGIRNGGQPVMQFSVFSNELVLLDFWYGTCKGCIKSFPKLEYLQKKFAGKFRVLLVNFESTGKIDSVFSKWRKISSAYKLPDLLSVTSDTVLHQLFSVTSYPHFVWIDNRGIIKAVTDETEVTEENIEAMIRGKAVKMEMKTDYILADPLKPMFPLLYEKRTA